MLMKFYDSHDVWHFLSALSMFFSFLVSTHFFIMQVLGQRLKQASYSFTVISMFNQDMTCLYTNVSEAVDNYINAGLEISASDGQADNTLSVDNGLEPDYFRKKIANPLSS